MQIEMEENGMGLKREFSFEDDIELLNLKYQVGNIDLSDYFKNEIGADESIQKENELQDNNIKNM